MSPRPTPGKVSAGDVVAGLIWFTMQAVALVWLVSATIGFNWITGWFSFSPWAGR